MEKTCFTILIFFVSITLAQDEKSERDFGKYFSSSNDSSSQLSEANLRAAGISFPSWEEIRDSFQKFQEQLNHFRRYAGRTGSDGAKNITNSYYGTPNGGLSRDGVQRSSSDENESESTSSYNARRNPPDSAYPPGFIRRPNPYGPTTSTPTLPTSELQRHTTTTIYIICICLGVMVIGSALFMCVNKCQETGGLSSNSPSSSGSSGPTRETRRDRTTSSRTSGSTLSIVIPSESSSSSGGHSSSTSGSTLSIPGVKYDPKHLDDLPPSYDMLFPNGKTS